MDRIEAGTIAMKTMSARDAKNAFGMLIDTARAEPVTVEKHGRPVVVVLSVEEFERLSRTDNQEQEDDAKATRRK
jgi:prevent-host-death family protein